MDKTMPLQNGAQAVEYIHSFSWLGSRPGLSRTRALLSAMGNPEQQLHFIHIVGTNGKGSTAAMLASVLTAAGYRTGLYTSPYIHHFEERMTVDGEEITGGELAEITQWVGTLADRMEEHPTEFELVTCVALEFYRRRGCDIVVLEAGMGGRLDSTNVIPAPEAVVITNIGLDHTAQLGNTVEAIAAEKAAVIKDGCPVILYEQSEGVTRVVKQVCEAHGTTLTIARADRVELERESPEGQWWKWKGESLFVPMLGDNQRHNGAVVLHTLEAIAPKYPVPAQAHREGLARVRWPGRFEVLSRNPWFVVDGGHNPQCAATVAENLTRYFPGKAPVLLMGVLEDKDRAGLCELVAPLAQAFVTITPPSPRALDAETLAHELTAYGKPAYAAASIPQGVERAMELAGEDGLVCALGSLYSVGEIRTYILSKEEDKR